MPGNPESDRLDTWRLAAGIVAAVMLAACSSQPTTGSVPSSAQPGAQVSAEQTAAEQAIPGGQRLYAQHCSACHGPLAEGDGPVADAMRVTVPNLRTLSARSNGVFPRDAVAAYIDGRDLPAAHGDRYMPVWGETFAADGEGPASDALAGARIAAIVDFLERIQN